MPDLLPDDFGTETVQTPAAILREQAEYFTQRMGGLVVARVNTIASLASPNIFQSFVLEVPSLDDYTFSLFEVIHPAYLYPLEIRSGFEKMPRFYTIEDQSRFEAALREVFAHPEVRKVVSSLKAQAAATVGTGAKP